jgi:hypothetical protein
VSGPEVRQPPGLPPGFRRVWPKDYILPYLTAPGLNVEHRPRCPGTGVVPQYRGRNPAGQEVYSLDCLDCGGARFWDDGVERVARHQPSAEPIPSRRRGPTPLAPEEAIARLRPAVAAVEALEADPDFRKRWPRRRKLFSIEHLAERAGVKVGRMRYWVKVAGQADPPYRVPDR